LRDFFLCLNTVSKQIKGKVLFLKEYFCHSPRTSCLKAYTALGFKTVGEVKCVVFRNVVRTSVCFIFILPSSKKLCQKENAVKEEIKKAKAQPKQQAGSVRKQRHPSTWRTVPSSAQTSKIHS